MASVVRHPRQRALLASRGETAYELATVGDETVAYRPGEKVELYNIATKHHYTRSAVDVLKNTSECECEKNLIYGSFNF